MVCLIIRIVNFAVDVTVYHRGYHGDLNETFLIGEVNDTAKKLVHTTWECLQRAIEAGNYFGCIIVINDVTLHDSLLKLTTLFFSSSWREIP